MVNVFAGWCDTCQAEAGLLKRAQQELARHGGEVLGVTYQDSSGDAQSYMQKNGLHYPVLLDPGDSWVAPYGVNARAGDVHHRPRRTRHRGRPD